MPSEIRAPEAGLQPPTSGGVRLATGLALGAYVLVSAYIAWRCVILQPYSDMFDWLARYFRFQANGDWAAYLLPAHNTHRLVWTFGVLALDATIFGAKGYLFVAVGLTCLAVAAALLGREAWRAVDGPMKLAAATLAVMLALMAGNLLDASIAINTTYVHGLAFAVAAIVLAEPRRGPVDLDLPRIGALVCIVASAFGNATGLALWPVLLFSAWRSGASLRWFAVLGIAGAGFVAWYFHGAQVPAGAPSEPPVQRLIQSLELFLNYLGLPWTRAAPKLGWLVGLSFLTLSLAAITLKGGAGASRAERVATRLILFTLATAAMAAMGRTSATAPWDVPLRYGVFLIPMHVGLLMLALPYLARLRIRRPRSIDAAMLAGATLMIGHQLGLGLFAARTADVNRTLIADFRAGIRTAPMLGTVYPEFGRATVISAELRRRGIYQQELHAGVRAEPRT
jgi:hypothetical protein